MIKKYFKIIIAYSIAYLHSYLYRPKKIRLDLCNLCQLDCAACWMRKDEALVKEKMGGFGYVNFETFKKFVEDNNFIEEIEISNNGEPLLNPDFNKIIKYAYDKNLTLTAWNGVNLNYLTEEMAENIVKYQFREITVSIDGATPETYSIYRRNGDFNKVIENVKRINKYKEIYGSIFPKLVYKFIVFEHNKHEIDMAKQLANNLNMDFIQKENCIYDYENATNSTLKSPNVSSCYAIDLLHNPQINFNGDLLGCCVMYLNSFNINVFEVGLLKALKDRKIISAKAGFINPEIKLNSNIPCFSCHCNFRKKVPLKIFIQDIIEHKE